ncbi:hypothetical protein JWJ88_21600 (plasmid) [Paracoccus methylovorus]|uniref:Hydantoin racemase n=1 Tax=Paracoccus methylovorus TaxID=2812658 RepID=A0ABX7JU32_9RHOB|nr:aspartate/glutamate racemase family protein [Paracoccus methylovorus]QRZ16137.1 hypothetical protein JWJ88_21600 [Paracoccus methylovorus]
MTTDTTAQSRYRFLLIQGFRLPSDSPYLHRKLDGPKETTVMDYPLLAPMLEGVAWDVHGGAPTTYGNWPVENRREFMHSGLARLPIVKEACESGKYNAIILLGGGEPGFHEATELARPYGIPVSSCAWSQMHVAAMLGSKFGVIDLAESHSSYYSNLILQHRMEGRCASIRLINFPHDRPGCVSGRPLHEERAKARSGERSVAVDEAVEQAVAAIEEDGAEVIFMSCSGLFWLQPFIQARLDEMGWEVPVLHGYKCAISTAKAMVDMDVTASGLKYPGDRPRRWRRKKVV